MHSDMGMNDRLHVVLCREHNIALCSHSLCRFVCRAVCVSARCRFVRCIGMLEAHGAPLHVCVLIKTKRFLATSVCCEKLNQVLAFSNRFAAKFFFIHFQQFSILPFSPSLVRIIEFERREIKLRNEFLVYFRVFLFEQKDKKQWKKSFNFGRRKTERINANKFLCEKLNTTEKHWSFHFWNSWANGRETEIRREFKRRKETTKKARKQRKSGRKKSFWRNKRS